MDEDKSNILLVVITIIGILSFIGLLTFGYYKNHEIKVDNFQKTIKDLSDEQKCIHICGFEWHGLLESYKFCMEKCDRISERQTETCD